MCSDFMLDPVAGVLTLSCLHCFSASEPLCFINTTHNTAAAPPHTLTALTRLKANSYPHSETQRRKLTAFVSEQSLLRGSFRVTEL